MGKEVFAGVTCLDTQGYSPMQKIEAAGRICYDSNLKAKPGSDEGFVRGILNRGHESVIEHEGAVFLVRGATFTNVLHLLTDWPGTPFFQLSVVKEPYLDSNVCPGPVTDLIVSGNFRAFRDFYKNSSCDLGSEFMYHIVEKDPLMDHGLDTGGEQIAPLYDPGWIVPIGYTSFMAMNFDWSVGKIGSEYPYDFAALQKMRAKHGTLSFRIDGVSRALTHQLVRHRPPAYSQRSQRYCGESSFDYIVPPSISVLNGPVPGYGKAPSSFFPGDMDQAADHYVRWQELGVPNEDARFELPNACETNIVVSATLNQWKHMINLRTTKHAQWEIRNVFKMIHQQICEICPNLGFEEIVFEEQ